MALITDLPAATSLASTDLLIKDTGSTTQKITVANVVSSLNLATGTSGTFTPQLYNFTTYVRDLPTARYIKVGGLYVIYWNWNNPDLSGITQMMQIRNLPCSGVIGGSIYLATFANQGGAITVQTLNSPWIYFRPNITSSQLPDPSAPGSLTGFVLGV